MPVARVAGGAINLALALAMLRTVMLLVFAACASGLFMLMPGALGVVG